MHREVSMGTQSLSDCKSMGASVRLVRLPDNPSWRAATGIARTEFSVDFRVGAPYSDEMNVTWRSYVSFFFYFPLRG